MKWLEAQPVEEWEQADDPRLAAGFAATNVLAFAAAEAFDLEDLLGLTLAMALIFLVAGYIFWERRQPRTSISLLIGTLPIALMLWFAL